MITSVFGWVDGLAVVGLVILISDGLLFLLSTTILTGVGEFMSLNVSGVDVINEGPVLGMAFTGAVFSVSFWSGEQLDTKVANPTKRLLSFPTFWGNLLLNSLFIKTSGLISVIYVNFITFYNLKYTLFVFLITFCHTIYVINQELVHYIKEQLNKGVGELKIRNELFKKGWKLEDIQLAFGTLPSPSDPFTVPIKNKPKNIFNIKKLGKYIFYFLLIAGGVLSIIFLPKLIGSNFSPKEKPKQNIGVLNIPTDMPTIESPTDTPTSVPVLTRTPSPTSIKPTIRPTAIPTKKVTPKPTSPPANNNSNPYNLTSATGSVKVHIRPQNGVLIGDQIVELHANGGYKVLVNQSADMDTRIARQGEPEVVFSTVPSGTYYVKVRYKADWTGNYDVYVNPGAQTTINVTVSGDILPTNTPIPTQVVKPRCNNPVIYPSSTGTAPFAAILQPQGESTVGIIGYEWDLDNNGSYEIPTSPNAQNYTFSNPGTYTVVMRVVDIQGNRSDPCSTVVTVN